MKIYHILCLLFITIHEGFQIGIFRSLPSKNIVSRLFALTTKEQSILEAFRKYKEIHSSTNLPQRFVIPFDDPNWPKPLWGMKLGLRLQSMRQTGQYANLQPAIEELGFDCKKQRGVALDDIKAALIQHYHGMGTLKVKQNFVVAKNDTQYPLTIRGKNLYQLLYNHVLKRKDAHTNHTETFFAEIRNLLQMNDSYNHQMFTSKSRDQILICAFETYIRFYNKTEIPVNYIVPTNIGLWPQETWGLMLGQRFQAIKHNQRHPHLRSILHSLGYNLQNKQRIIVNIHLVNEALEVYYHLYQTWRIPTDYRIPINDTNYPSIFQGKRLYDVVYYYYNHPIKRMQLKRLAELDELRTQKQSLKSYSNNILKACQLYKQLYNNTTYIPANFIVPNETISQLYQLPLWPKEYWNMRLGMIYMRIRSRRYHQMIHPALQSLGYELNNLGEYFPRLITLEEIRQALITYYNLHGSYVISKRYLIPENDTSYPIVFRGKDLRKYVYDYYYTRFSPRFKHIEKLDAVGFSWNSYAYRSQRIFDAYTTYQQLYNTSYVSRSFRIPMNNTQWPKETWGLPLGQRLKYIRYRTEQQNMKRQHRLIQQRIQQLSQATKQEKSVIATKEMEIVNQLVNHVQKQQQQHQHILSSTSTSSSSSTNFNHSNTILTQKIMGYFQT
jgi:hypothetical protein